MKGMSINVGSSSDTYLEDDITDVFTELEELRAEVAYLRQENQELLEEVEPHRREAENMLRMQKYLTMQQAMSQAGGDNYLNKDYWAQQMAQQAGLGNGFINKYMRGVQ